MGAVHLGTMVGAAGERPVAVKQLLQRVQGSPGASDRIVAEARLVFQLVHANICQVLDLAVSDEGTFIVMEFVDGCDLQVLLRGAERSADAVEPAAAIFIAKEIAAALDYAHRRKDAEGRSLLLVHGDVTPKNILLSREGEVKLADFGIARALGAHAPGNELSGGTPGFIAPEVLRGESDQRADLFSLGVTLKAALTLARDAPLPRALHAIVERLTATRAEDRYSTAREVEETLSLYLARQHPSFTRSQLASIVHAHAGAPATEKGELVPLSLISLTGTVTELQRPVASAASSRPALMGTRKVERPRPAAEPGPGHRWRSGRVVAGALAAAASVVFAAWMSRSGPHGSEPVTATVPAPVPTIAAAPAPSAVSPHAPTSPQRRDLEHGSERAGPRDGRAAAHRASARLVADPGTRSRAVEMGYLTVHAEPWGTVLVDGRRFADQTPVYRAPISAGAHRVAVFNPEIGRSPPPREVTIKTGQVQVVGFEW
jgi:serine/threonine-protein kinase